MIPIQERITQFLVLVGLLVGLDINATIRKPGALHRARWMAKAIYSMKMELLYDGNETVLNLTGRQLQVSSVSTDLSSMCTFSHGSRLEVLLMHLSMIFI